MHNGESRDARADADASHAGGRWSRGRAEPRSSLMSERIVILDRGNVEIAIPERWTVTPKVEGHLDIRDPTDACKLEISYLRLPPLARDRSSRRRHARPGPRKGPR